MRNNFLPNFFERSFESANNGGDFDAHPETHVDNENAGVVFEENVENKNGARDSENKSAEGLFGADSEHGVLISGEIEDPDMARKELRKLLEE